MEALEVPEHEHPLTLVDLQLQYEEEEDDDDADGEGGDPVKKEGFSEVACGRCDQVINMYHRHYYKCMKGGPSCDKVSLHKFCGELSTSLESTFHPHPLTMFIFPSNWSCRICQSKHQPDEMCYCCFECRFFIDLKCAVEVGKKIIHHPCHPHSLICAISQPILCNCKACGREHKGVFFQCTICDGFTIHSECAFLPKSLLIQHTTDDAFFHTHPLTISYSFPTEDQKAKHYPRCRVCGGDFSIENLWIYKCDKCMYYAHLNCATSRREPFMSIFLPAGSGRTHKNYKDIDYPRLVHLPFPDETYSIPKHLFFQETRTSYEVNLKHMSHPHPLILVDHAQTSSLLPVVCHDPMKKTQLLCTGCLRPIMETMSFYKCAQHCNFALHEWCTRLPPKIKNHPGHPKHTLLLMYSNALPFFFGVFYCEVCRLPCNGFAYCCVECGFYVDVTCGFIPKEITHQAHPNHLLSIVQGKITDTCHMCFRYYAGGPLSFRCNTCHIFIHPECALLLAETIRHKYDKKHPMNLSYLPIENHKSEYFCEICEEDLNPHDAFYHCQDCAQSIHTACAPLILECETETYSDYQRGIYGFVNIKFGEIHNTNSHQHPLLFAQGRKSDGQCEICLYTLQFKMIFKCIECKFAIHYSCCVRHNTI
ncbi:uncharacterized protein LOC111913932 isoform X1 [Lactuca sativa]|uniref:Phorbol-ester/DAG-type domain-containing protein n=2 Tax=Lactuca sativa TaxID=4236 RepID=A0A9R1USX6_LACSA|nr:uncharacterized protein LOC111913932 isoform X1 [Lactuca sativa]KAJ0193190.1 hypothetical protein LSAT_V11C800420740 [Lactuca sativa]